MEIMTELDVKALRLKYGLSQQQLADKTGIPKGRINNWEQGQGQPKGPDTIKLNQFFDSLEMNSSHLKLEKGGVKTPDPIPFYDAVAVAGIAAYQSDLSPVAIPTETVNPGTWFRSATAAMRVYGDSMFPKYKSGCIIALKEIIDKDEIVYGEDYVMETSEQRVLKRVMKSEKGDEYIEMNSINPQTDSRGKQIYASKDFHLTKVKRVYKVLGQICYEAGGDSIIHQK
jgi:transcriptional regulator with XRE-family HTH domain